MRTAGSPAATPATHIVGPVPVLARLAGLAAVVAGLLLLLGRFPPYVDVGGVQVSPPHGPLDIAAVLLWPGSIAAAGVSVILGRLPRLGLAVLAASGAVAIGLSAGELYQLQDADSHRGVEIFFGQRLVTSSLQPLAGVWVQLTAYILLVVVLVLTLLSWSGTTMDDAGDFDGQRPRVMGLSALTGLIGALAVAARPQDVPDQVLQSVTGFRTTVEVPGEVSLLDRLGLDLLGGALLAVAVFAVALLAATWRPRLAAVGGLAGLAAYFLSAGLLLLLETGRYADVVAAPGGWLHLLAGVGFAGLAGYCLRAGGRTPPDRIPVPVRRK
ncbi:MAG: hypothetical protein H0V10_16165 [Geodermatophilaceae bacterium]|nr:hypothetical protein [Geodermatophilaceae bacterium]